MNDDLALSLNIKNLTVTGYLPKVNSLIKWFMIKKTIDGIIVQWKNGQNGHFWVKMVIFSVPILVLIDQFWAECDEILIEIVIFRRNHKFIERKK